MGTQSYLSLYTTIIGWLQYQNLWRIIEYSGLAFLPFVGLVISNFVKPLESQEAKDAGLISQRRMEIEFVSMLLVIMLACQPLVPLNPHMLSYAPVCVHQSEVVHPGNTGTTYDSSFHHVLSVATGIKVPFWWYGVMALSQGITSSANEGLLCLPNLRQMRVEMSLAHIQNAQLRTALTQFYQQCFVPARAKYLRNNNIDTQQTFAPYLKKYGNTDTEWIGSHGFNSVSGYYNTLQAQQPVLGFLFDPMRDWQEGQSPDHSPWGEPSCRNWWSDPMHGLRVQLVQALPKSVQQSFSGSTPQATVDTAIKSLLLNDRQQVGTPMLAGEGSFWGFGHLLSSLGAEWHQITSYSKLYLVIEACPIVQALLLMAIYAFLPLGLVFTRYRMRTLITGTFVIFSITFWSYLWHIAAYVDQVLIQALYPNWFSRQTPSGVLVNMIVGGLYIGLPLLWTSFMGWMGVGIGNGVEGFMSRGLLPAQNSGAVGTSVASSIKSVMGKFL